MGAETGTTLDRSVTRGAKRLGAWGPGVFLKHEGVWRTHDGVLVGAERGPEGGATVYRELTPDVAAELLRANGYTWRADHLVKRAPAGEADAETAPEVDVPTAGLATVTPKPRTKTAPGTRSATPALPAPTAQATDGNGTNATPAPRRASRTRPPKAG